MSSLADQIRTACLLEATAAKPGNVHPEAAFVDMTYLDLVRSAEAVAGILATAPQRGVGPVVLEAVEATAEVTRVNTNLGIILLLAPLAAVPADISLERGIDDVIDALDEQDASCVFAAIRQANPGGLGKVPEHDVTRPPTVGLLEAMQAAADHDSVAACYANRFSHVLSWSRSKPLEPATFPFGWQQQVVGLALSIHAVQPDTLIARKCGINTAIEASRRARIVLQGGWPDESQSHVAFREFDTWLRADGHRRNPGTTADLVTATLFAALRESRIPGPDPSSLPPSSTHPS
ncbi:MAG TPA: triphosphoribosyl-dephospho-CoA synthetase [Planctomycetaceae bacterium]|nr:triphosphoribosyl-dephospho-CoA synthetase [Planctomycetaceae bacterium]|tara:strand:- start:5258 stop:6133 length:876 start_codon:yes stop_codon:yes gene_type:complete